MDALLIISILFGGFMVGVYDFIDRKIKARKSSAQKKLLKTPITIKEVGLKKAG